MVQGGGIICVVNSPPGCRRVNENRNDNIIDINSLSQLAQSKLKSANILLLPHRQMLRGDWRVLRQVCPGSADQYCTTRIESVRESERWPVVGLTIAGPFSFLYSF